ncbi:hypothetical protein cypCar_00029714 [Cyprinus carpio]|nr:hypothetical protein cypCar_00029714 [Cyprinus carpio]
MFSIPGEARDEAGSDRSARASLPFHGPLAAAHPLSHYLEGDPSHLTLTSSGVSVDRRSSSCCRIPRPGTAPKQLRPPSCHTPWPRSLPGHSNVQASGLHWTYFWQTLLKYGSSDQCFHGRRSLAPNCSTSGGSSAAADNPTRTTFFLIFYGRRPQGIQHRSSASQSKGTFGPVDPTEHPAIRHCGEGSVLILLLKNKTKY